MVVYTVNITITITITITVAALQATRVYGCDVRIKPSAGDGFRLEFGMGTLLEWHSGVEVMAKREQTELPPWGRHAARGRCGMAGVEGVVGRRQRQGRFATGRGGGAREEEAAILMS